MRTRALGLVVVGLTVAVMVATATVTGASSARPTTSPAPTASQPPLDILLTNDDGWRGAGGSQTPLIVALRDALRSAGHDVVVVAPGTDQSGQGGRFSLPPLQLDLANPEPDVWTLTPGSPADSVYFAVDEILGGDEPDLVISGINPGNNMGTAITHSGTVNAALTALELGIPSLAVSLGRAEWDGGGTVAARQASEYVVGLVDQLQRSGGGRRLMPEGVSLNVNYPLVPGPVDPGTGLPGSALEPRGTRPTSVLGERSLVLGYEPAGGTAGAPGRYSITLGAAARDGDPGTDVGAVNAGYVSVTPLEVDHDLDAATTRWLRRLTRSLG